MPDVSEYDVHAVLAQLVGWRLVTIIQPRYHQAHLAGFAMHLSTGRSPLLGRPVIVPALRRDGTEIPFELVVQSHHFSADRLGFVAHACGGGPQCGPLCSRRLDDQEATRSQAEQGHARHR
jgi:hypothetical protein